MEMVTVFLEPGLVQASLHSRHLPSCRLYPLARLPARTMLASPVAGSPCMPCSHQPRGLPDDPLAGARARSGMAE